MNVGKNIQELAFELDRRAGLKHDVVADATDIRLRPNGQLKLEVVGDGEYIPNDHAHGQLAAITQIPKPYYNRLMGASSAMLAGNVNFWMEQSGRRHMVRTLDGTARAVVSDRFNRIENEMIAQAVLPALYDIPDATPVAMDVTDKRLYMKFIFATSEGEVKVGDPVRIGLSVSNSEIGMGQYVVRPFIERLVCLNGMKLEDSMGMEYARRHLGSRMEEGVQQIFSMETVRKDHEAIMSATADIIKAIADPKNIERLMSKMREATTGEQLATTHVHQGVEVLGKELGLTTDERVLMMGNLIQDHDFSRWGVANAITKIANDLDFDRADELEDAGGKLISMSAAVWDRRIRDINALKVAA